VHVLHTNKISNCNVYGIQVIGMVVWYNAFTVHRSIESWATSWVHTAFNIPQIRPISYRVFGSIENTWPKKEGTMRDQIDQRPTDTTRKWGTKFPGRKMQDRKIQDWKCRTGKCRTKNAGVKNPGPQNAGTISHRNLNWKKNAKMFCALLYYITFILSYTGEYWLLCHCPVLYVCFCVHPIFGITVAFSIVFRVL